MKYIVSECENCIVKTRNIINQDTGDIFKEDINNPNYQEYLAWLAEGNEPLQADEVNE